MKEKASPKYEKIMAQAVKMAKNRRRYKPKLSILEIAQKYGVLELSIRKRLRH
jgi:hypothetical protein